MRSILGMTAAVLVLSLANAAGFAAEKQSAVKAFDACMTLRNRAATMLRTAKSARRIPLSTSLCAPVWRESRAERMDLCGAVGRPKQARSGAG
jgi:hypothetical protein